MASDSVVPQDNELQNCLSHRHRFRDADSTVPAAGLGCIRYLSEPVQSLVASESGNLVGQRSLTELVADPGVRWQPPTTYGDPRTMRSHAARERTRAARSGNGSEDGLAKAVEIVLTPAIFAAAGFGLDRRRAHRRGAHADRARCRPSRRALPTGAALLVRPVRWPAMLVRRRRTHPHTSTHSRSAWAGSSRWH